MNHRLSLKPSPSRRQHLSVRRRSGKNPWWPKRRRPRQSNRPCQRRQPRRRARHLHRLHRDRQCRLPRVELCRRRFGSASRIRARDRHRLLHRVVQYSCGLRYSRRLPLHRHRLEISAGRLRRNRVLPARQRDLLARGLAVRFRLVRELRSGARDRCRHSRSVQRFRHGQGRRPTGRPCIIGRAHSGLAREETSCRGRRRLRPRRWLRRRSPGPSRWPKA